MFEGEDDIIFPRTGIQMRVNIRDMQVCLFEVAHPEIKVPYFIDGIVDHIETLKTYSFLFGIEDLNEDRGALCVYNGLEHTSSAKIINTRGNVLVNFVDVANKINKRDNYNLIYFGERNEG